MTAAIIAAGESLSAEIDLYEDSLVAFQLPGTFTGTKRTFQASATTGGTFADLKDDAGAEVEVTVAQGTVVSAAAAAAKLAPIRFIKVRSGATGNPTVEVAERQILLITKKG
jgi:hypothetical protein